MALTPEKKVKNVVRDQLRQIGAYFFMPATGGYGKSGVPDIVGCYEGRFFGIECKAGKGKLTALQQKNLNEIYACKGIALVVNRQLRKLRSRRSVLMEMLGLSNKNSARKKTNPSHPKFDLRTSSHQTQSVR
jgi:Holliday junction resolvase